MRKVKPASFIAFYGFALFLLISACKNTPKTTEEKPQVKAIDASQLIGTESKMMLDYLNELGDYVNSRNYPSLIKASVVYENLGNKQLIIDIRKPEQFSKGHIKDAVNLEFKNIPEYFESEIVPFEFNKIVIVSDAGQTSSYTACLLRLMGYGNVYSLRWGMSSWNNDFAQDSWFKAIDSKYEAQLETEVHEKAASEKMPEINTGKTTGEEILMTRIHQLFAEDIDETQVDADDLFSAPSNYYIMNYIRRDKYEAGHIPGAIRYKPEGTLGIVSEMSTIPVQKELVVYCGTGHNSGFITAYLRLFGYDAKTLMYGNNSFMHNKMVAEKDALSWLPFSASEVENYPYVK